jgi:hypothetical protein
MRCSGMACRIWRACGCQLFAETVLLSCEARDASDSCPGSSWFADMR